MDPEHHPKLSPIRAFQVMYGTSTEEDQNTSLSDYHDYEPRLEFDDSELSELQDGEGLAPLPPELLDVTDEDFEQELADAPKFESYPEINSPLEESDYTDLQNMKMVEVMGDDELGRRIIIVSACRLPPKDEVPQDRLLRYLMCTLDRYVEQDYTLVYFHHGLDSKSRPAVSWLWKAYKAFDRKYKKNLKALYLVHPTGFVRFVWQVLRPAISVKFGKKMMYVNYLHELRQYLDLDKLCIPQQVLDYDKLLLSKYPRAAAIARANEPSQPSEVPKPKPSPPLTLQFGVSLQFIKDNNADFIHGIPPIVRQCVEYLSKPEALDTEGLFRRSANKQVITELQHACNRGEPVDFRGNPHNAAVLLKTFLKHLEEPLLTFNLYEEISSFQTWPNNQKPRFVKIMIMEKLPLDNYKLLKYLMQFLWLVKDRSCVNKMTTSNLAVVFGPNLVWPPDCQMSLQAIAPINAFTEFLISNHHEIFVI